MLQPTIKFGVESEVAPLSAVVVHTPGREHDLMKPDNIVSRLGDSPNPDYLLFDDLVQLERAQQEHRTLIDVLTAAVDDDRMVFQFAHLLMESISLDLEIPTAQKRIVAKNRQGLFAEAVELDQKLYPTSGIDGHAAVRALESMDPRRAVRTLIEGRDIVFREQTGAENICKWPTPNLLFTRDLAAVVKNAVIVSNAREPARKRETLMSAALFATNPRIRAEKGNQTISPGDEKDPAISVEGGDIMVVDRSTIIVGTGARTTEAAFKKLLPGLFELNFDHVIQVEMPPARASMHFDTIFTFVDHNECIVYAPLILGGRGQASIRVRAFSPANLKKPPPYEQGSIVELLSKLRKTDISVILCASGHCHHEDREQWSDAVNTFALAPGKIVAYDRNPLTLRALNRHGYRILRPEEFVANARYLIEADEKICVVIPGAELSRGRGGPRCMTMPLSRRPD